MRLLYQINQRYLTNALQRVVNLKEAKPERKKAAHWAALIPELPTGTFSASRRWRCVALYKP